MRVNKFLKGPVISLFLCFMVFFLIGCTSKQEVKPVEETSVSEKTVSQKASTPIEEAKETIITPVVEEPKVNPRNQFLVCIDPGHQGQGNPDQEPIGPGASRMKAKVTSGTRGVATGRPESEVVLEISLKLRTVLEEAGYKVILTRDTQDIDISNKERADIANENGAHAFLRIHLDGSEDSSATGILGICQTSENPFCGDLHSQSLALNEALLRGLIKETNAVDRGVMQRDDMSGINWSKVPVSILELGFMTNPNDDQLTSNPDYQNKLCQGILIGLDKYFQIGGNE